MNFNDLVCIVERCSYWFFEDYLTSINIKIRFYPCKILEGEAILVVQKLLDLNYEEASFIGLLNTEQLTTDHWSKYYKNIILNSKLPLHLFDYSLSNIKYLETTYGLTAHHIPYRYRSKEINHLKNLLVDTPKEYDLAFIGVLDPRRRLGVINTLKKYNLKINIINSWRDKRDKEIAKCKFLLNIHVDTDYNIYEEMQYNRWLMAGMTIITEPSLYDEDLIITYGDKIKKFQSDEIVYEILNFFEVPRLKIGIAIPTYINDIVWLIRCLDSIQAQITKPSIVSISASSCKEEDIKHLYDRYSFPLNIIVTHKKQTSIKNRNIAASYIKNVDLICFFNSHDEMRPELLSYVEKSFINTNCDFLLYNMIELKSYNQPFNYTINEYVCHIDAIKCILPINELSMDSSISGDIRSEILTISYRLWCNEKYNEDSDYVKRLTNLQYCGNYIETELGLYHRYTKTFEELFELAKLAKDQHKYSDSYQYIKAGINILIQTNQHKKEYIFYVELADISEYLNFTKDKILFYYDKIILSQQVPNNIIQDSMCKMLLYVEQIPIIKIIQNGPFIRITDNDILPYEKKIKKYISNYNLSSFRLISPLITYKNGYLAIVCQKNFASDYYRFISLDKHYIITNIGKLFKLDVENNILFNLIYTDTISLVSIEHTYIIDTCVVDNHLIHI